jgi:DNA-directed RNA polymerase specialized sigma24 family protein
MKQYEPLIGKLALQVYRRVQGAGLRGIDLDDVKQEIRITWYKAEQSWSPDKGANFQTFFRRAVYLNVNRWLDGMAGDVGTVSLDDQVGDDGETTRHEMIADDAVRIDTLYEERQVLERVLQLLKPEARMLLQLVVSPPPELFEGVTALQARAAHGRACGFGNTNAPSRPTLHMIADLLGLSRTVRQRVYREIEDAARKVNRGRK